ncbi:hypothetical protein BEL04_06915 [Mucilaginibacter sp. PPCGB 2223]|uniref:hypothetical protein n=1 Tax=Mucilaginibacter sp. PPCGB 2223 TaxID=1886027 RepID=UPI000824C3A8|nr:hypothetical protein [Mucilaginibacter sp. PPCGB 2223]OCX54000.1 hypothetical protein BEL04_06915 [Mucilaginibacter sp. PPCGB 2223]
MMQIVRSHTADGQQLLIVGRLDHKTGHEDPEKAFADLEKYIRKYYNVSSVKYRWYSENTPIATTAATTMMTVFCYLVSLYRWLYYF